jgi:DNA polymerase-3 subunit epsilon
MPAHTHSHSSQKTSWKFPQTMNFTSLDFETANPSRVSICAAGMAVFEDGQLTEAPYWLVRPPKGHGWFH